MQVAGLDEAAHSIALHRYRPGAPIHVVATTLAATRNALRTAAALAKALGSSIHVIAARPMPVPGPDPESTRAKSFAREILELPEATSVPVDVLPCVCRRLSDVVQLLTPQAVVVLSGPSHRWWPSSEQRLAHTLTGVGCHVVFVHSGPEAATDLPI